MPYVMQTDYVCMYVKIKVSMHDSALKGKQLLPCFIYIPGVVSPMLLFLFRCCYYVMTYALHTRYIIVLTSFLVDAASMPRR